MENVERIAEVVLYEGYLLFPYRRSSMKNQQRWTFGGVYPRPFSEVGGGNDPWMMQTQCLVIGDAETELEVKVRFLHVVDRKIAEKRGEELHFVDRLSLGGQVYIPFDEAAERTVEAGSREQPLRLGDLIGQTRCVDINVPEGSETETLLDEAGEATGAVVREWRSIEGRIELSAECCSSSERPSYRVTVRITNTMPLPLSQPEGGVRLRTVALHHTLVSTHTILRVHEGEFVSLLEPPEEYGAAAAECRNIKTWPVLVGDPGERHTVLSSPIILYDYPQVSPESQVSYFDGTEIDELLALSVLTLTNEEKQEMRQTDPRSREILDRTEALLPDQLMALHASVRGLQELKRNG